MKPIGISILILLIFTLNCKKPPQTHSNKNIRDTIREEATVPAKDSIAGEAPALCADEGIVHMSFASADSIYYSFSRDKGKSFAPPVLVAVLEGLVIAGNRGPQIVSARGQLLIAAPDKSGNFVTYLHNKPDNTWVKGPRINDVTNSAREGFISLDADNGGNIFAVWLDLRKGNRNNIFGAGSRDGGRTWSKNRLIYQSPDGSVCECCKPSIVMKDQRIAIMFRNNLKGNRDLYLIQSEDGGSIFDTAIKLGEESWKINACPMDGGGVVIGENGMIQTVWRREGMIYTDQPGKKEDPVGKGMRCMIDGMNNGYCMAYINGGRIFCRKPDGELTDLGPGNGYPKIIAVDAKNILCVWENDKKIYQLVLNV